MQGRVAVACCGLNIGTLGQQGIDHRRGVIDLAQQRQPVQGRCALSVLRDLATRLAQQGRYTLHIARLQRVVPLSAKPQRVADALGLRCVGRRDRLGNGRTRLQEQGHQPQPMSRAAP